MAAPISNAGYIDTTGVLQDGADKTIDAVIQRKNDVPLVNEKLMRVVTSATDTYKDSQIGNVADLPEISEDGGLLRMTSPAGGWPKSVTCSTFRIANGVQRSATEDDRLNLVQYALSGLMDAGRTRLEYAFVSLLNNAFSGLLAGSDSKDLCSATHPHAKPGGGTWSNLETAAALTHGTAATAIQNMLRRTNEGGHPMPLYPEMIMVPPELDEEARVIFSTDRKSGQALWDKNVYQGAVSVQTNPWLTDTNAWFMWANMGETQQRGGLVYFRKAAPAIMSFTPTDPDILFAKRLRMRFAVMFTIEPRVQGNAGA